MLIAPSTQCGGSNPRRSSPASTRIVRDAGLAEELAHDALVAALEQWPEAGIPANPGAWLMGTAKHRAIDRLRRNALRRRKHGELEYDIAVAQAASTPDVETALDDDVGDDLLRLMFAACHPVLSPEARVALTLRLLCGLTTDEIARAYLVPESTIAQRIVRAKRTMRKAGVPFEIPRGDDRAARMSSVLEVIYVVFNEGYSPTAGEVWVRPVLCEEALRLVRVVAELATDEPEVHGLAALLELQASRLRTRVDASGAPVRLEAQHRAGWDRLLIRRGLAALARARALGQDPGPYAVQAEIAACHAQAASVAGTDWRRIASLYARLALLTGSPIVELNRAVAVSMAEGPQAGFDVLEPLRSVAALAGYHLLPAVRADLLAKLGRLDEARLEFERAAGMTQNRRERTLLLERASSSRDAQSSDLR